jgi:hypothetical protein
MMKQKLTWVALGLLLAACGPNTNNPPSPTGPNTPAGGRASVVVEILSPICADTLRDRDIIPQQARDFGIDEAAVCKCGLSRTEAKLLANPTQILDLLVNQDAQIKFLLDVGQECTGELLQQAITGVFRPNPSPTPGPGPTSVPSG